MRLDQNIVDFIASYSIKETENVEIRLFGSRINNIQKGGDIDLLFLTDKKLNIEQKSAFKNEFFQKFGAQKLDLVNFTFEEQSIFKDIILPNSILLCQKTKNI